jgi:predicted DNA-binding protein (MmcQ/YjbR family)
MLRLLDLCRSLPGVTEDVKWDNDLVFSVGGKMFACFELPEARPVSFKVDPDTFDVLTGQPGIRPAPYLAKHGWVSVENDGTLPSEVLEELLEESHALVASTLPKSR